MTIEELHARLESRREVNEKLERDAEKQLYALECNLRGKANNDKFAAECWIYYIKNYKGTKFKSAIFSCNYLKDAIAGIENDTGIIE